MEYWNLSILRTPVDVLLRREICKLYLQNEYPMVAALVRNGACLFTNNWNKRNPFYHAETMLIKFTLDTYGTYHIKEIFDTSIIIIGTKPCNFCYKVLEYYNIRKFINLSKPNPFISYKRYKYFLQHFFKRKRQKQIRN